MTNKGKTKQRGFTLVEVLVALVILSIGLLGVAGMQINGMKGNHNAFLRSQALQYANEILDMMRANRTAAISSSNTLNYSIAADKDPTIIGKTGVALNDLLEWRRALSGNTSNQASSLPGGTGAVAVTANADNTWTAKITISWTEGRLADDATPAVVVETKL